MSANTQFKANEEDALRAELYVFLANLLMRLYSGVFGFFPSTNIFD